MEEIKHTDKHYEEALDSLTTLIAKMGNMASSSVKLAMEGLSECSKEKAKRVIADDILINEIEVRIDEASIDIIALRQPAGRDLRFVTTALKIVTDLERVGDLAVNISERAIELMEQEPLKAYSSILRLSRLSRIMLDDAIVAFLSKNESLAMSVIKRDSEVDDLNRALFRELVTYMLEDPKTISRAISLVFISKYLERVADHATNIAEMVFYMVNGEIIKHKKV